MKIISWNVNGIRAAEKKGFLPWLLNSDADIVAVQEIKAMVEQLSEELLSPEGYRTKWNSAERKGYSGVANFYRGEVLAWRNGLGIEKFDREGRVLEMELPNFTLFNIYFPNGKKDAERLQYKLDFYDAALEVFDAGRAEGKKLIITGDYNTAHKTIDLTHPKANEKTSGFLPVERVWLDKLLEHGYLDAFRLFEDEGEHYTWWSMRSGARARNVGWRIDYFFVSDDLRGNVTNCVHYPEVMGSDHCPLGIELQF